MFTIQAAVTIVTAGFAANLFGIKPNTTIWSIIITLICLATLLIGKYKLLDHMIKVIIVILTVSTLITVSMALFNTESTVNLSQILPQGAVEISFLIAFLGWMPAPLDISTWHSLWALEKRKKREKDFDTKQSLVDFNIG